MGKKLWCMCAGVSGSFGALSSCDAWSNALRVSEQCQQLRTLKNEEVAIAGARNGPSFVKNAFSLPI